MRRLLLVKLGAIGDCVMLLPAARAMADAGFEVEWVCGEMVAPVLRLYPWIHVIEVKERPLLRGNGAERTREILRLWRRLRKQSYDVCATMYYDARFRVLTMPVRAQRKFLLSRHERAEMLLPGRHHTDEYARVLMHWKDDETPVQLPPVRAVGLPASPLPVTDAKARVVLAPGGARNLLRDDALRRWPVVSYAEVAAELLERGHEVVLCGGPNDVWVQAAFAGLGVKDFVGKLTLVETLALFDSADVVVTHDTGPLHLAGLTRSGVVGLFGPTDPRGRLPQRAGCVALWGGEGFACRPCYDGKEFAPCTHNGCIRQVTPAMVLHELERMLSAGRAGAPEPARVVTPVSTSGTRFL